MVGHAVTLVRGGSWNNNQDNARAAYRNNNHPANRNNNNGVRVVFGLRPTPLSPLH
jgi:formylglycine-generating enzyme required for sulfatase activity